MNPENIKVFFRWTIEEALQSHYYWYFFISFLTLLGFLWVVRKTKKDLPSVFSDEEGSVCITSNALHELVKKNCEEIPDVHQPSTSVLKTKGKLRLCVRLNIDTNCDLIKTRAELKRRLEEIMVEKLNFQNFEGIDIIIKGFQHK